eukprot:scaffold4823_cov82-Skeletonema_dohrnii-CCMP3373.AAC.16
MPWHPGIEWHMKRSTVESTAGACWFYSHAVEVVVESRVIDPGCKFGFGRWRRCWLKISSEHHHSLTPPPPPCQSADHFLGS